VVTVAEAGDSKWRFQLSGDDDKVLFSLIRPALKSGSVQGVNAMGE